MIDSPNDENWRDEKSRFHARVSDHAVSNQASNENGRTKNNEHRREDQQHDLSCTIRLNRCVNDFADIGSGAH